MGSETTCPTWGETLLASKSVTKVQRLPNIGLWTEENTILKDYILSFFLKHSPILRMRQTLPKRKRVMILTSDEVLLVYETNSTGYSFNVRAALKMKTIYKQCNPEVLEKSCTVTLKYKFGCVNLVLINEQISIWRRTLFSILEGDAFDKSLLTDLSLYTAKDDDLDQSFLCNDSIFNYTEDHISLQSVPSNVSPTSTRFDETQMNTALSERTNSNRSLTLQPLAPSQSLTSVASSIREKGAISIRRGAHRVSYLAKKFQDKLGSIGHKIGGELREEEHQKSSPLEILFPPLPVKRTVEVSQLDYMPSHKLEQVLVLEE